MDKNTFLVCVIDYSSCSCAYVLHFTVRSFGGIALTLDVRDRACLNSFACGDLCHSLIIFADSLGPDQG